MVNVFAILVSPEYRYPDIARQRPRLRASESKALRIMANDQTKVEDWKHNRGSSDTIDYGKLNLLNIKLVRF